MGSPDPDQAGGDHAPAPDRPLRFTWREFCGGLGDLGLFIPLVVGMSIYCGFDLGQVLVAAGLMHIASGLCFRQPIPVQPMKSIAAVAIAGGLSADEVRAAGLLMGGLLLLAALTNAVDRLARLVPLPVVRGIQFGVGLKLVWCAAIRLEPLPWWGVDSLLLALVVIAVIALCARLRVAGLGLVFFAGFLLLYFAHPGLFHGLRPVRPVLALHLPPASAWQGGLLQGALPQLPLTLLNSVIALCALSSDFFPAASLRPRAVTLSVGLMNLLAIPLGGIPMCHGAGGLAAQYRFGARTGGSVIMLGAVKICAGLVFGCLLVNLLAAYPGSILAPMLAFAGWQLARAAADMRSCREIGLVLATAAGILWYNTLAGFLAGCLAALLLAAWTHARAARPTVPAHEEQGR